MIYFNNPDIDGRQFIEIEIAQRNDIDTAMRMFATKMPDVAEFISIDRTEPEILVEIPASGLHISLDDIRNNLADLYIQATIDIFTVDLSTADQRCYH